MKEIRIKLSDETYYALKEFEDQMNYWHESGEQKVTINQVLKQFCEDLTCTPGSGSDERLYASNWFGRHIW